MPRNTGKQETDAEEFIDEFEDFEGRPLKLHPSYHARMLEFLAKSDLQVSDAQFSLYKYDNYDGSEGKALIDKFYECEPPDEHETGMKYGAGRYALIMIVPPSGKRERIVRVYKFRCHPIYDKRRAELYSNQNQIPAAYPVQQQNTEDSFLKAFSLMQGLLSSLLPILRPPETPDMAKLVNANYALIGDVMKKNMMSNIEMMNDYQRKMAQLRQVKPENNEMNRNNDNDTDDTSGVMEVIGAIAPMLEQWLPKLVGGGATGKATANIIKSTDMFKEIMSNRKLLTGLITYLDQSQGPEQTTKVLNTLGVRRSQQQRKAVSDAQRKESR